MTTYMKIDQINGDVTAKGHENWIEISDLHFQTKRTLSIAPGRIADREGTRPQISEITVHKKMDCSSPLLFSESCVGKAKAKIQFDICQTNDLLSPYAQITISNAIISGYELNTDLDEKWHYPLERVTISFDKIELRYTPYDSENNAQSPIPAGYDLRQAVAA